MKVESILKEIMINDLEFSRGHKRSVKQYALSQLDDQTNALIEDFNQNQIWIEDTVTIREGDLGAIWVIVLRKIIFK